MYGKFEQNLKLLLQCLAVAITIIAFVGSSSFHGKFEIAIVSPVDVTEGTETTQVIDTIVLARHNRIAVIRDLAKLPYTNFRDLKVPLWTYALDANIPVDGGKRVMGKDATHELFGGEGKGHAGKRGRTFADNLKIGEDGRSPTIEINSMSPITYDGFDWFRNRWHTWRIKTGTTTAAHPDCLSRGTKVPTKADGTAMDTIQNPVFTEVDGKAQTFLSTANAPFCKNLKFVPKCQCPLADFDPNLGSASDLITRWVKWSDNAGLPHTSKKPPAGEVADDTTYYTSSKKSPFVGNSAAIFADTYYHWVTFLVYIVFFVGFYCQETPEKWSATFFLALWLFALILTGAFHFNQFALKKGLGPFLLQSGEMGGTAADMKIIYGQTAHLSVWSFSLQLVFSLFYLPYLLRTKTFFDEIPKCGDCCSSGDPSFDKDNTGSGSGFF